MRRQAPDVPDHVKDGKTLPQQIEGDHAYRDEPPEHDPRPDIPTVEEVRSWFSRSVETDVESVEALDPKYHDGDPAFDVTIKTGLLGTDLEAILGEYHVEEMYISTEMTIRNCRCCGSYATGYAEFTIVPREFR